MASIKIVDDITPEVIDGLKLFAKHTSRTYDSNKWLYWFRDNPYGNGLHGLAIHQEKIIGYYSLIPTEMRLAGKTLICAKGEFLVVDPNYRKHYVSNPRIPLAFDLVKITNEEAIKHGIQAILVVATDVASLCHEYAGAKKFVFPCRHFFTFFRLPKKRTNRINNLLVQSKFYSIFRIQLALKSIINKNGQSISEKIDYLDTESLCNRNNYNRLVSQNPKMLNFRFSNQEYLKYLIHNGNDMNYLIFRKPKHDGRVVLKDWSSLELRKSEFEDIFIDLYKQCKEYEVESIHISIPDYDYKINGFLHKFGFLSRRYTSTIYISSSDDVAQNLDSFSWDFTDSHTEYI